MYKKRVLESKPRLDAVLVKKSITSLLRHSLVEKRKKDMKTKSTFVDLQFLIDQVPKESKTKPILINLANTYTPYEETSICIFTPDPRAKYQEEIQGALGDDVCVISLKQLKSKYNKFSLKKELAAEFDAFFAVDSILVPLCPLLGKSFFDKKKQPAGIRYDIKTLPETIHKAVESTRLMISNGNVVNIHIGKVTQSLEEVEENIFSCIEDIVQHLNGWENIRTIHTKTDFSIALPLYKQEEYVHSSDSDTEF